MRSAVILAGGSSSRLGAEKSLLEFGGSPLLCHIAETLLQVTDEVIVVARDENHARCLMEQVEGSESEAEAAFTWDSISGFGPVAGLDAGLRCAKGHLAFVTGCDLPFLNVEVIDQLFDLAKQEMAVRPWCQCSPMDSSSRFIPFYDRKKMLCACQRALRRGERRIHVPLQELRVRRIPVQALRPLDSELLTFFNLNTAEDLNEARRIWSLRQR